MNPLLPTSIRCLAPLLTGDESLTAREWIEANVRSTGPLGGNDPGDPSKPGWGGQFQRGPDGWWRDLPPRDGFDPRTTVSRWRPDFQRDFAQRMAWCRPQKQ